VSLEDVPDQSAAVEASCWLVTAEAISDAAHPERRLHQGAALGSVSDSGF
jgi:hypothetical protein